MPAIESAAAAPGAFQLRFESLFQQGRAMAFPCDGHGHVTMDRLSERARSNYLYARAVVGREFATPMVVPQFDA
jgi:hypothetical protein